MQYSKNHKKDIDPIETQEWIESLKELIDEFGPDRAHFILNNLISFARRNGIRTPFKPFTDYVLSLIHI